MTERVVQAIKVESHKREVRGLDRRLGRVSAQILAPGSPVPRPAGVAHAAKFCVVERFW